MITIDTDNQSLSVAVKEEEFAERKKTWSPKVIEGLQGTLKKYNKLVATASEGCVTDKF
jgi:dihydroxy-acid dehydratase